MKMTQSDLQRDDFKTLTILSIVDNKLVTEEDILRAVSLPNPTIDVPTIAVQLKAEMFLQKTVAAQRSLVFIDFDAEILDFQQECEDRNFSRYKEACTLEISKRSYEEDDQSWRRITTRRFVDALLVCPESTKSLFMLAQLVKENELLTSLAFHRTFAIVCGARIFYATSGRILKPKCFCKFIDMVIDGYIAKVRESYEKKI
jgi:hypothetical protein